MSNGPKRPVSRLKAMPPLRQKRIDAAIAEYVKRREGLHTSDDFIKAMARRGLYAERPRPGKDLLLGKAPPPVPSGRIQPAATPVGSPSPKAVRNGKGGAATPAKDRGGKKPHSAHPKNANRGTTAKPAAGHAGTETQLAQQLAKIAIALSGGSGESQSDFVQGHVPRQVQKPQASSPANNVQPKTNADQKEKAGNWVPETPKHRPEVTRPFTVEVPRPRPEHPAKTVERESDNRRRGPHSNGFRRSSDAFEQDRQPPTKRTAPERRTQVQETQVEGNKKPLEGGPRLPPSHVGSVPRGAAVRHGPHPTHYPLQYDPRVMGVAGGPAGRNQTSSIEIIRADKNFKELPEEMGNAVIESIDELSNSSQNKEDQQKFTDKMMDLVYQHGPLYEYYLAGSLAFAGSVLIFTPATATLGLALFVAAAAIGAHSQGYLEF